MRKFLGFANYFRRFIDGHSTISRPLEEITGKNSHFEWSAARQKAFESLKSALLEAPVLQLADVEKSFTVETDASDFDLMTDNMGVVYLRTKPTLTKREARWVEFLADYDFMVFHKPGKKNIADPHCRSRSVQ